MDSQQTLDTAVRLELYRFFVDQGRPPVPAEVAQTLATDQASVEDSLRRLAQARVLVLAPGAPTSGWLPRCRRSRRHSRSRSAVGASLATASGTRLGGSRWWGGRGGGPPGVRAAMSSCR